MSILRLEKTIKKLEEMRSKGSAEIDIRACVDARHRDFDQRSRTQIYRLSLGLVPKDDFTSDDLKSCQELNGTTLEIVMEKPSEEFHECSLVFYEGQRWVVVAKKDATLVLKRF